MERAFESAIDLEENPPPFPLEVEDAEPLADLESLSSEAAPVSEKPAPLPPAPLGVELPRSLAFTGSPTIEEFIEGMGQEAALLRMRMSEARLPADDQLFFTEYGEPLNLVAVVGAGLPETAALLPLWVRIAGACPRADLRVIADDDLARLELLLQDDAQMELEAIELPMLLIFDEEYLLQAQWGPRPQAAEPWLEGWLAEHPDLEALADSDSPQAQQKVDALTQELGLHMRVWYNSGLDAETSAEIRTLLASLRNEAPDSPEAA